MHTYHPVAPQCLLVLHQHDKGHSPQHALQRAPQHALPHSLQHSLQHALQQSLQHHPSFLRVAPHSDPQLHQQQKAFRLSY